MTAATPIRDILLKLCRREDLTRAEAREAFSHIMSGEASEAQIGGLLVGLAAKGTTVEELVGAAGVMREKAVGVSCGDECVVLDTCGTGGDVRGTFNISTAAALVVAAAGGVARAPKHSERGATLGHVKRRLVNFPHATEESPSLGGTGPAGALLLRPAGA